MWARPVLLQAGLIVMNLIPAGVAWGQRAEPNRPGDRPVRVEKKADERERREAAHLEVPEDRYAPAPPGKRATSPAMRWTRDGNFSVQVNVNSSGANILGDAGNEPSIAVDPTNPLHMAIGWRQFDTVASNFRQAGWSYTTDGGRTWTFPGVIEPGVFRSDPVLGADTEGNFYYNSLTADEADNFWCHVFKSTDGGITWDSGTYAFGGDKQWMVIDQTTGIGQDNIYAFWTQFYSSCGGHFTRSYDGGQSYLDCTSVPGSPLWGTLAVGPDGELYIGGDGFVVAKSSTMQEETLPLQWDFSTTVDLDGSMGFSGGPNPGGLLGQVWIAVDRSDGPNRGNVYLLCSVQRTSTTDPLDVMFARSTNGGVNWSAPVRINDDSQGNGAYQWFGTMSVAPNGRIDVIWNDTRNDPGGHDSELYYSHSEDGGVTWSANEALSPPYDPHVGYPDQNKMGDYFHLVSDNLGANLAYSATFNNEEDVYYMRIGPTCPDAGTVTLDRPKYACESIAHVVVTDCGLNNDDEAVEFVTVDIDSDSESGAEQVMLTETDAATARFEGSIGLSSTNGSGVLQVTEGDTVTVTYTDADDGQGGSNVDVQATATVDCSGPVISNVQAIDITASAATVSFDTDEPAHGSVRYGTSCGSLNSSAVQSGFRSSHGIRLNGLTEDQTYLYAVDVEDEAGNPATDDNGGACHTFTTVNAPNNFTEIFEGSGNDLDFRTLTFTPNGSADFYAGCVESIGALPTDPAGGTTLSPGEDSFAVVNLTGGKTVSLYGVSYSRFYVGSNGYITFTSGDGEWVESLEDHFSLPRISALFDDFSPQFGGPVSWKQLSDRAVVTYQDVPEYNTSDSNTFQIEMYFDGRIVISNLDVASEDGLVGLSAGAGVPADFYESDLSALGSCFVDCNHNGVADGDDLDPGDPDGNGQVSSDENGNGVPDECDLGTPSAAPYPHDRRKNRYISFDPNKAANDGINEAFRVELKSINLGSCDDSTGGNVDFCRIDRGADDCNSCVGGLGGTCINTAIHCSTGGGTCTPTGATCVNDAPNSSGSNVGQLWWVGPEHPSGNGVHLLVSESFRKESTDWGTEFDPVNHPGAFVVHVGDCEVVPQATYGIRAVIVDGGAESGELIVETTQFPPAAPPAPFWWADAIGALQYFCNGDIRLSSCTVETQEADCGAGIPCQRAWTLPNGSVNFDDVNAALTLVAPPGVGVPAEMIWVDLHGGPGDAPPNGILNSSDLQQFIFGFGGFPYAGYDPKDCPDVGTWP